MCACVCLHVLRVYRQVSGETGRGHWILRNGSYGCELLNTALGVEPGFSHEWPMLFTSQPSLQLPDQSHPDQRTKRVWVASVWIRHSLLLTGASF